MDHQLSNISKTQRSHPDNQQQPKRNQTINYESIVRAILSSKQQKDFLEMLKSDIFLIKLKVGSISFQNYARPQSQSQLINSPDFQHQNNLFSESQIESQLFTNQRYIKGHFAVSVIENRPFLFRETQINHDLLNNPQPGKLKLQFTTVQAIKTKDKNSIPTNNHNYLQTYRFDYRRQQQLRSNRISNSLHMNSLKMNSFFNHKKNLELKHLNSMIQEEPLLQNILSRNESLMFAVTKQSIFEIKLTESKHLENIPSEEKNKTSQKYQKSSTFRAKFPLRPFLQIPFTHHQIDLQLYHQTQDQDAKNKSREKSSLKSNLTIGIFCVPGQTKWGQLQISEIKVKNWRNLRNASNQGQTKVGLHFQFSDAKKLNELRDASEIQRIEMKVLSLQEEENPCWTDQINMIVNAKRNNLLITLVQMDTSKTRIKQVISSIPVNLLADGFLNDGIDCSKSISLLNVQQKSKTAEMTIKFIFRMSEYQYQPNDYNFDYFGHRKDYSIDELLG